MKSPALRTLIIMGLIVSAFFFTTALGALEITGPTVKNGALLIPKAGISAKASFFPFTFNGVKMEVFAVKASDGTIRTAFNTCQVCFDSGRGFYVQEGDQMVCQNCGNRFKINQIEKIKNGCNPIPITTNFKKDKGSFITISNDFIAENTQFFKRWKR